jgi:S1-C subfamily serine protease
MTKNNCRWAIYVPQTSWKGRSAETQLKYYILKECITSTGTDIAVCYPAANPFLDAEVKNHVETLKFGNLEDHADGSAVAFTGFPLGRMFPVTSKGYIAAYIPTENELLIDKSAWPGASGSPVYDENGQVLGLLIKRGTNESAGLAFARPTKFLLDFLRHYKIAIEK